MYRVALLALAYFFSPMAFAQAWDFTLHKHQSEQPGPTMLVIGGIQGDEPGGFNAASLLTTNYRILRGEVWVVPNLNFESIIKRSRGVHGDMNRKFKDIPDKDPEFQLVQKIKRIIRDQQVDIILNLHDGSGFYRPQYIDRMHSPYRWGQSLIIDQATLENVPYGQLRKIADTITNQTNTRLSNLEHRFHVKNTKTREGNREMEKTLTYYAIQNGKAAFGLEASKSFDTHYRAYYHLQLIESFMQYLGIEYQREFNLTINQVKDRIDNNIKVALYQKKMLFDMSNVRSRLGYIPMKKNQPVDYHASNPLIAVLNHKRYFNVRYGNRSVTKLVPQYFDFDNSLESVALLIDGEERQVKLGDIVAVDNYFQVNAAREYRVNVIGFTRPGVHNESGIRIKHTDIRKRYSVDTHGHLFRIEIYKDNRFCGMVLVDFSRHPVAAISKNATDTSL
ncbi:MAG: M99 family carboxypeptidase catalytic domain-containing protein [Thioalkalispiraceae bacterium]|jgi:hypothetical protein